MKLRKKILVIDDDPVVLDVVKVMMEENSFESITASSTREGLTIALESAPHLILLDLMLPSMSGLGLLRELKKNPQLASIPVIVLTGLGDQEVADEAKDLGAAGFMTKGCSFHDLISLVKKVTDEHHPPLAA